MNLPPIEKILFGLLVLVHGIASIVAVRQVSTGGGKHRRYLLPLLSLGTCLGLVLLIVRAVAIKAIPLTGLFDSMIILMVVFGIVYLVLCMMFPQVWLSSVVSWVMLVIVLLSALVATPAVEQNRMMKTPWIVAHALSMIGGSVMILFASVSGWLYLLGSKRLKLKQLGKVMGMMPNIEKLEQMNLLGLKVSFGLLLFGIVTGFGYALVGSLMGPVHIIDWLIDSKIVLSMVSVVLLGVILVMRGTNKLSETATARMTLITLFLILFAMVGVQVFCKTNHGFSDDGAEETPAPSSVIEDRFMDETEAIMTTQVFSGKMYEVNLSRTLK